VADAGREHMPKLASMLETLQNPSSRCETKRTKVTVFANTASTYSLNRYTAELAANLPPAVEAKAVYFQPVSSGIQKQIDRYWRYMRLARKEQGDYNVIVSEGCAYLLLALPKERTICVCHDVHSLAYAGPKDLHHRLYDLRYRASLALLPTAKFVVTVSDATRRELLRYCRSIPEEKTVTIHNGLERRWKPVTNSCTISDFRNQHQLCGKRVILHVGEDVFYKNVPAVLRAFAQLPDPDLVLLKIGGLTQATQGLVDLLGIRSRLRHLTQVSDDDLVAAYNTSDMLVFPSLSEGFGWPPLEAMACGCPVIASNCASILETCEDACLYVHPADFKAIAAMIARVLREENVRVGLRERGLQQAAKFSWKNSASEFLRLFQQP